MPTPTAQQEPTMEEILASIRRIISEDSDPGKPGPVMAAQDGGGEVLEVTNIVHDDGSIGSASQAAAPEPRVARRPAPAPQPAPMPQRREPEPMQLRDPIPEPRVARRPAPMSAPHVPEPPRHHMRTQSEVKMADNSDREGILSNQASSAVTNAFGMLSRERDVTVGANTSLEDMVQQMLKPMLAAWLEQNLPEIVERVVQEEVERASRTGRRR
jgi:hypothetical protein